jgi:lysozyme
MDCSGGTMINEEGLKILKESEGLFLTSYKCPAGIWTIGYGTTIYPSGKRVQPNEVCTYDQAREYLEFELKEKAATIKNWINNNKLELTGNQFSALLCFAFNLGCGPIIDKDRSLSQAILHNKDIRKAFMMYNKIKVWYGTKELRGLTIRRTKEADLYFTKG